MADPFRCCCGQGWSPAGRMCPDHALACNPPTGVGVRVSHLGVLVCPGGGTRGVSSHFCLVMGVACCGAGINMFRVWYEVGVFGVAYDVTLGHIRSCLLLLMRKAKIFTIYLFN